MLYQHIDASPWVQVRFLPKAAICFDGNPCPEGPVKWRCAGCGWDLSLKAGALPPMEHTIDRPLFKSGGVLGEVTPREEFTDCPNPTWERVA